MSEQSDGETIRDQTIFPAIQREGKGGAMPDGTPGIGGAARLETRRPADCETELQHEARGPRLAWLVIWIAGVWTGALRWWNVKSVCAWCGRRMRGNPSARTISHGICRWCSEQELRDAEAKRQTLTRIFNNQQRGQTHEEQHHTGRH